MMTPATTSKMSWMLAAAAALLAVIAVLPSAFAVYTITPTPHVGTAHPSTSTTGRHPTFVLSSHHTVTTTHSSSFKPLSTGLPSASSRFSLYQLADSNTTGCGSIDFSALVSLDGQGPFRLIVDTGSTTLAVASSSCTTCVSVHPTYTPTQPSVAAVSSSYGGGTSWAGHSFTAAVSLSGSASVPLVIASIESNDQFINSESCQLGGGASVANYSQGIMGFGYPSIAVGGTGSWVATYIASTSIANEFTVQMCTTGGNLWVGDYDPAFLASPFTYVPVQRTNYFSVLLTNISVYTQSLSSSGTTSSVHALSLPQSLLGPCVSTTQYDCARVDSGTTQMILPTTAYSAIVAAVTADPYYKSLFNGQYPAYDVLGQGVCTSADSSGMPSLATLQLYLPKLAFTFAGPGGVGTVGPITLMGIPGYMTVSYDVNGLRYYCPGVEDARSDSVYPLLGYAFLTQFTVRHDLAGQRMGFAQTAQCGVAAAPLVSYEWVVGSWGACSASCGEGTQWRQVNCTDMHGSTQPDIRCAVVYLSARPVDSQSCTVQQCSSVTPTAFTSLSISSSALHTGQTASISYSYTGGTPDYLSLFLTPADNSSLPPFYITPNASKGTGGAGVYAWTVPATAPNGTFLLGAFGGSVPMSQALMASAVLSLSACTNGGCALSACGSGACNGRGQCSVIGSAGVCACVGGYSGATCQSAPSNGACTLRCLNGGSASASCQCTCASPYTGALCEQEFANVSITLDLNAALISSASGLSVLSATVASDVSYALGLDSSALQVQAITVVNATTVAVSFLIVVSGNTSVLPSLVQQLTTQAGSGTSAPLGRGLTGSSLSSVTLLNAVEPSGGATPTSSSSTSAPSAAPTAASSTGGGYNATGGDATSDGVPESLIYIVAGTVGGAVVVGALLWLWSCFCRSNRRGTTPVMKQTAGGLYVNTGARSSSVVQVSPKAQAQAAHQPHRKSHVPSHDYGY